MRRSSPVIRIFLIIAGDRDLLGFLRTVREVGLYSFGCNVGNIVTLAIGTPVISGVWPTIRRMEENPDAQAPFVRQVTTFVCVAGVGLAVGLSIFAGELIRLLASRPEFVAAAIVVPLLTFSQRSGVWPRSRKPELRWEISQPIARRRRRSRL